MSKPTPISEQQKKRARRKVLELRKGPSLQERLQRAGAVKILKVTLPPLPPGETPMTEVIDRDSTSRRA
jgi:hypothetical protein